MISKDPVWLGQGRSSDTSGSRPELFSVHTALSAQGVCPRGQQRTALESPGGSSCLQVVFLGGREDPLPAEATVISRMQGGGISGVRSMQKAHGGPGTG